VPRFTKTVRIYVSSRSVMSRDPATAAGGSGPPAGAEAGGYLGSLSNLFTSLAADASASATRAEDRVLDAVEAGIDSVESSAKHLRSSLAALSSAETRARAMASLTRRADLAPGDPPQLRGASAYVATLERAIDDYDVNNAHHVARAQRVSDAARALSTKLKGHANAWRETDFALAELPDTVASAWAVDAGIATACDLMAETEQLLLEAEIAVEVDELYRRDEETRATRKAAKTAHKGEVEKLELFRRVMETEARDTQVTMKSAEEIALEEGLRRELRAIKKRAGKRAKSNRATEDASRRAGKFLPAPTKEDHYGMGVESDDGDEVWRPHAVGRGKTDELRDDDDDDGDDGGGGGGPRSRGRGTLAEAAGAVDVATALSRFPGQKSELDDFLADDDDDDGDGNGDGDDDGDGDGGGDATDDVSGASRKDAKERQRRAYYTVYGLRKQADDSRAAVAARREAEAGTGAVAWLGSKSREAAEAIGLARREALGLDDDDLIFVNLKPPPPSGGAGDDLLAEAETVRGSVRRGASGRNPESGDSTAGGSFVNYEKLESATVTTAAAAKEVLESAGQKAAAAAAEAAKLAESAKTQAGSVFAGFGSSLLSFGEAARRDAAASLEAAQGRAKESAAWMHSSIVSGVDSWQRHLQGGSVPVPAEVAAVEEAVEEGVAREVTREVADAPEEGTDGGGNAFEKDVYVPVTREAMAFTASNAPPEPREPSPLKIATPAAEREDRDEGFDEVMTKDATFGYWKEKEREEAGSHETSLFPSPSKAKAPKSSV